MDLTSIKTIKNLLGARGINPSRGLGQNFLVDKGAVGRIMEAAELNFEDIVLEIGPGLGTLTQELAKKAERVIAVEKDPNMVKILEETLGGFSNIEIIRGDIRKLDPLNLFRISNFGLRAFKVVGNLPFYLTSPIIRQFLEHTGAQPLYMVLVVQKEVAQRMCAKAPNMNLLAVSAQFYAEPKIISYISKKSFWPAPRVDAAIIRIAPLAVNKEPVDADLFFKIVKAGFSQPRKQLINNLSKKLGLGKPEAGEWLKKNGVRPSQRAQTLTINDWIKLTKNGLIS